MGQIGRYHVVRELGRGGMGVVFEAADPLLRRRVAIKTIRLDDVASEEERRFLWERLVRESQAGGRLAHPNVVAVFDILNLDGMAYLVMEYVDGSSLQQVLERGIRPSCEWLLSLLTQTADALDLAHSKGIVHRDVKPGNIMVTVAGVAKVADFGLARFLESPHLTRTGVTMGSPFYMAPEQVEARAVDGRTDQFALAVVAYEALSGERPFQGDSVASILFQIVSREPERLTRLDTAFTPHVQAVLRRALSKQADARYASCRQFVDALAQALREPAAAVAPATAGRPGPAAPPRTIPPIPIPVGMRPAETVASLDLPGGASGAVPPPLPPTVTAPGPVRPAPAPVAASPAALSSKLWLVSLVVVAPLAVVAYFAFPWVNRLAQPGPTQAAPNASIAAPPQLREAALEPAPVKPVSGAAAPAREASLGVRVPEPRAISKVAPAYPPLAREARAAGAVVIDITIGRSGRVKSARLVSGHPLLVNSAMEAVRQWVFEPVVINGRAIEARTQVGVNFQLK